MAYAYPTNPRRATAMKTTKPRRNEEHLQFRTPAEFVRIAANESLHGAAVATTPLAADIPQRMADAFHEASHIVGYAVFGVRTQGVHLPRRDATSRKARKLPYVNACMSPDPSSRGYKDDEVGALQRVAADLIGEVAEHVNGSRAGPPELWDTTDTQQARAGIRYFLTGSRGLSTLLKSPEVQAYRNDRQRNPATARTRPPERRYVDADDCCLRRVGLRDAITIMFWNFELIDAVAAIILRGVDTAGDWLYPRELSDWVMAQLERHPSARACAGRICAYDRPDWLPPVDPESLLAPPLYNYRRLREVMAAMAAVLPTHAPTEPGLLDDLSFD